MIEKQKEPGVLTQERAYLPLRATGPPLFSTLISYQLMKRGITVEASMKNGAGEDSGSSRRSSFSSGSVSKKIRVGQLFKSRQEFTTAVRLQLMEEGKGWKVDKGGARQAGVRCAGHDHDPVTKVHGGCGFRITVCKQTRGSGGSNTDSSSEQLTWKVTSVVDEHVNCSGKGPPRRPGVAEIRAAGHPIISNNPKITASALQKMIKVQAGIDVHVRTANRLIRHANSDALSSLAEERAAGFQHLGSYLEELADNSGGTITDVKVSPPYVYCMTSAYGCLKHCRLGGASVFESWGEVICVCRSAIKSTIPCRCRVVLLIAVYIKSSWFWLDFFLDCFRKSPFYSSNILWASESCPFESKSVIMSELLILFSLFSYGADSHRFEPYR